MQEDLDTLLTLMATHPLFDDMDATELASLAKYVSVRRVGSNVEIFQEGDEGNEFYYLVQGKVEVRKHNEKGQSVPITTLTAGKVFGEMALIDGQPRSATIRTKNPVTLISMSLDNYEKLCDVRPAIALDIMRNVAKLLSNYLRNTSASLADMRAA